MYRVISELHDSELKGKKVLIRVDYNVSVNSGSVGEDFRIRMTLPTIEYLIKRQCKIILISHLGRPTERQIQYSLAPIARRLSEMIGGSKVKFTSSRIGEEVLLETNKMQEGTVLLLENLRFYKEEEMNDPLFSRELASLADIYVNDAFSTSHRKHSSTYGAAKLFEVKLAGFNLQKEVEYLSMIRDNPDKPLIVVLGGAKIKDKIGALENLLPKADKVLIGGAAAYTFLKAKGINIGNSLIDLDHIGWVTKALSTYSEKIMLPSDHVISSSADNGLAAMVKGDIPDGMMGLDIGNETVQRYSTEVGGRGSGTVLWNGPMGWFEIGMFANGTINVAKSMALAYWRGSKTLVGGGDTLEAMRRAGVSESEVSHVSTGGGASLRFLAGDEMPGLSVLSEK
jgi:phosphoglycerate kinase